MSSFAPFSALILAASLLPGCGGAGGSGTEGAPSTPAPARSPSPSSPRFIDVTAASGIDFEVGFTSVPGVFDLSNITFGGAAAGDYDSDGDIDVFITAGNLGPNRLYENVGNLTFIDVASAAGIAYTQSSGQNYRHSGPTFADLDGDGDLDLFLGGIATNPSLIFRNNGDKTFSNVTSSSGIDALQAEQNVSAAFGDYDLDGDLDMFVAHWGTERSYSSPGDTEHLWRNDTDANGIRFTSASVSSGIAPDILTAADPFVQWSAVSRADWTFTPTFARINDDLYPDLLSVADYNMTKIFLNNRDNTFSNATNVSVITDDNGMGSAVGDYDNDGDLDWFVSSILARPGSNVASDPAQRSVGNRLYRNDNGIFSDVTEDAGVADGGWGWGSCFLDFENDGDLDIYHTNGYPLFGSWGDFNTDRSRAFVSDGAGQFEDRALSLGLADTAQGRGVVCADFDNDGDVDILQLHDDSPVSASLWENRQGNSNYLRVILRGLPPNTEAAGARITAQIGSTTQMREITIGSNYTSQNPTVQIFGLAFSTSIDELTVEWPDGITSPAMTNVLANQTLTLTHPNYSGP